MPLEDFFTWGKDGRKMTPDQLAAERAALAIMQAKEGDTSPVGHWTQGMGRVVNALAGNYREGKADKAEAAGIAQGQAAMDPVLRALMGGSGGVTGSTMGTGAPGGTWTPAAPPPSPTAVPQASGGLSMPSSVPAMPQEGAGGLGFTPPPMTPQQMIIAGAEARGLDPIDVATAISYETGGKFDPMIAGPTTQWGTHRGLIQFGEPQAQQYGADFSTPEAAMTSQLNPETGAVWNYLDQTGVTPGMGLDNIYSAINAGAPGRFNASDANNGGAAGTVAQKVAGMGDHRQKAAEFLGGTWTPNPDAGNTPGLTVSTQGQPAAPQGDILSLLMAAQADPWAAKQYGPVINALMGSELTNRQNAQDPLRQLQIQQAQLELQKAQRPQTVEVGGVLLDANTYQPIFDSRKAGGAGSNEFGLTPQYITDKDGNLSMVQLGKDGSVNQVKLPEGSAIQKGVEKLDLGTTYQWYNTITGEPIGEPIPKDTQRENENAARGTAIGAAQGASTVAANSDYQAGQNALDLLDSIRKDPAIDSGTGLSAYGNMIPGTAGYGFAAKVEQAKSGAFMTAIQQMRGMGALSNAEGSTATAAVTRMNTALSKEDFMAALNDYEKIIRQGMAKAQNNGAVPSSSVATTAPVVINGVTIQAVP